MAYYDEYSSDTSTTGLLKPGTPITSLISDNDDIDWLRISLSAGSHYTFNLSTGFMPTDVPLDMHMVTSKGIQSGIVLLGANHEFKGSYTPERDGDYYLSLGGKGLNNAAAYRITASEPIADDAGNTLATAAAITIGQTLQGKLEVTPDIDQYRVGLAAGVTYTVKAVWAESALHHPWAPALAISGPDGQTIEPQPHYASDTYSFTATVAGDYYLGVRTSALGLAESYTLAVAAIEGDDYGASAGNAGTLTTAAPATGQLNIGADRDWYAIGMDAGVAYTVKLSSQDADHDGLGDYSSAFAQIRVIDSRGNVVAGMQNGIGNLDLKGYDSGPVLKYTAPATGTYYVEVGDLDGTFRNTSPVSGSYQLSAAIAVDDYGDTAATAVRISSGRPLSGKLESTLDTDVFKLSVAAGNGYVIELNPFNEQGAPSVTLSATDAGGVPLALPKQSANGVWKLVYTAAANADLYLRVVDAAHNGTADYTLKAAPASPDDYLASKLTRAVVAPGGQTGGVVDYAGDIDWIKVSLTAGKRYGFELLGQENGGGSLALATASLELAAAASPAAATKLGSLTGAGTAYTYTCTVSGNYYLAVAGSTGTGTGTGTGSYTVRASMLTGDSSAPAILNWSPGNGATQVRPGDSIVLTYSENIQRGKGLIQLKDYYGATVESYNIYNDNTHLQLTDATLTINPAGLLQPGMRYTVVLPAGGVQDMAGNQSAAISSYGFSIVSAVPSGSSGDDYLAGKGTAGQSLFGRAGVDTAVYASSRASYQLTLDAASGKANVVLKTPENYFWGDELHDIERLLFPDANVAIDLNGSAGQAYRIYQAAFNRVPDMQGLGYWIAQMDRGAALKDVASAFLASAEFETLHGPAPLNAIFASALYQNVLHRSPDRDGLNYWTGLLDQGANRAEVLAGFSESPENQAAALTLIGNGIAYTPYG